MSEERIFSDEELKEMGARTLDLLLKSIEEKDHERATMLGKRMYAEFLAMHDLYRDWITHLLSFIGTRYGDGDLSEALNETVFGFTKRLSSRYANKGIKRKVQILAAGLRGHLHPFTITEEGDCFVITASVCGSGGRLVQEGAYDAPEGFLKIKDPQPMTFERADFPVYCAHCYFQNNCPVEGDEPLFITEPADNIGEEACIIRIPK